MINGSTIFKVVRIQALPLGDSPTKNTSNVGRKLNTPRFQSLRILNFYYFDWPLPRSVGRYCGCGSFNVPCFASESAQPHVLPGLQGVLRGWVAGRPDQPGFAIL